MIGFLDPDQRAHDPRHFMVNGAWVPCPEAPARIDVLRAGAEAVGCRFSPPPDPGIGPVAAVHTAEYLAFLSTIFARWRQVDGAGPEVVPNIFPDSRGASYPSAPAGQSGYHQLDLSCPIGRHTWAAARASARSAVAAVDATLAGAPAAYALCRPPGHHASADTACGFCYLNNAAIAAERFTAGGLRTAILDVDVHHGNGTQSIFYQRPDVLTVSIHADPAEFFPFYWGHAAERGAGVGLGAAFNLPLPPGTGDAVYLDALDQALDRIDLFGAEALVIALGLDAHEDDPFQAFAVTTDGFERIAARIQGRFAGRPVAMVQEGGYLSDALGANLGRFLTPFL